MNNLLNQTIEIVHKIVLKTGSITLANLECAVEASFHLLFLAIEQLIAENKIKISRGEGDYIISVYDTALGKKHIMIQPSHA